MDCKLRLAQVDTTLGNVEANMEAHLALIDDAIAAGQDLVIFPELTLTGYFLKDHTADVALHAGAAELEALRQRSKSISIAIGFVERGRDERIYNALAFFEDGELLHIHRKVHLVTYGMFEDARDMAAGERFEPVESKHGRFGFLTCEDAWHIGGGYSYFLEGVDALVICSASPGRGVTGAAGDGLTSARTWRTLQDAHALFFGCWVAFVNRVGFEDGVLFGGGTRLVDPFGAQVAELESLDPGQLDAHLSSDVLKRARVQTPLRKDEKPWILWRSLNERLGALPAAETPDEERA